MVDLLECTVMPYAWGSRTAIAELAGRPSPAPGPEAELWMGAHPVAPSRLCREGFPGARALTDVIAEGAERELGAEVAAAFGPRLPFLMKVLAASEPLSLQAHPTSSQAREGFADEDRRNIPRDAKTRNYRDPSHKPELLCALTPFDALCGFRKVADTLALFEDLAAPALADLLAPLRASPDARGLEASFRAVMALSPSEGARVVAATIAACERRLALEPRPSGTQGLALAWARRLGELYPGDVGVVSALLLNVVHLEPGEAIYLGAGNLHAYLDGVGVEIMASSDNVLRGGLTKKHIDVPELVRVLDFTDGPITPLRARVVDAHERVYETPAREFRLSTLDLTDGAQVTRQVRGPEILLCTAGSATIAPADGTPEMTLARGCAAFVPASTGRYVLRGPQAPPSPASVYRATVNLT